MSGVKALVDLDAAKAAIDAFSGDATEFELPISDELNDPLGLNMAILTDAVLKKGWGPDGFGTNVGFRTYKYKSLEE